MSYKTGVGRDVARAARVENSNAQIATKLRALYLSVQDEAIPDRFLDLLEKLDAVERQSVSGVAE
ncbi:NepR family anti-sigma factor [Rhizobium sp. Root482]|jgi:hypothetical protein|uniref:NepR family anti-sigma factor n=1 Tax=Rhizobium sp. Root482 TaxID=1736543 RepID=UPI0006FFCA1A|nr:NepR family anti-sigma factor [Rhizobium sp. Root482]KQY15249.1 hypothetical protein ASD31_07630 [Rhizobium sp. Root482]